MNKEKIISDLCLMYGSGYRGEIYVEETDWDHTGQYKTWETRLLDFDLINEISDGWIRIHKIESLGGKEVSIGCSDVIVKQRPFSDLMVMDAIGVCDADRLAMFVENFESLSAPEISNDGNKDICSFVVRRKGEPTVTFSIDEFGNLEILTSGTYSAWTNTKEITDFLRSRAYLVPESLKGGQDVFSK